MQVNDAFDVHDWPDRELYMYMYAGQNDFEPHRVFTEIGFFPKTLVVLYHA